MQMFTFAAFALTFESYTDIVTNSVCNDGISGLYFHPTTDDSQKKRVCVLFEFRDWMVLGYNFLLTVS